MIVGYYASCDACNVNIVIDGDGTDVPEWAEWETFPQCPICGDTLHLDEMSETQWNRESRLMRAASEAAVKQHLPAFVAWVASQRAYNGSEHRHAQSLYNECINGVLPEWAAEYIAEVEKK